MAITGLAGIKKFQEEQAAKEEARNRPKADWLSGVFPKDTGNSIEVRFMQELDVDMKNYDEKRGVGFIALEHHAPGKDGFKRRASCTLDESDCYPCERHKADYAAGWKQRQSLYINVAVLIKGELKPFLLTRNANSTFANALIQEAIDEGSITDSMYRITKSGSGTQTQWMPKRLPNATLVDDSQLEVFDINETALRDITYDKQPEWYGEVVVETPAESTREESSSDVDW